MIDTSLILFSILEKLTWNAKKTQFQCFAKTPAVGNIDFSLFFLWALFSGRVSRQLMLGAKKQATNDRGHCHLAP